MKVLSIGNSFSQDAQHFLHEIANAHKTDLHCVNLYIGGCSLEQHYNNIKTNACEYDYEINGAFGCKKSSIKDALLTEKWDIVTLQQASYDSGIKKSYSPYLGEIINYVKSILPNTEIYIHETWSYEINSDHSGFVRYDNNQEKMYKAIKSANEMYADEFKLKILRVGDAIQYFRENVKEFNFKNGGLSLNRDGFHLSLLYGRYIAAAIWYKTLVGSFSESCGFLPEDNGETADKGLIKIINENIIKM